jgi:hypothetical protein
MTARHLRNWRDEMAYDASKDKVLLTKSENDISVSLCQYNGGEVKLQISRTYRGEWTKLGRLTIGEAMFVYATMAELMLLMKAK